MLERTPDDGVPAVGLRLLGRQSGEEGGGGLAPRLAHTLCPTVACADGDVECGLGRQGAVTGRIPQQRLCGDAQQRPSQRGGASERGDAQQR